MRKVSGAFSDSDESTMDKMVVPLHLSQIEGELLVSRSQAKAVGRSIEHFKHVELDFAGIAEIGRAFADELFRVFVNAYPEIRITTINTEPAVARMIRLVVAARAAQSGSD